MRDLIKHIVFEEFSKLTTLIEKDFSGNYKRKVNNFLLSQMDENITASMVFVSSFESKSGFAIETCAKRIARLKFGEENVPAIVNPRRLMHNIDEGKISGQVVVTDVDTHNGNLRGEIATFRATNEASGSGRSRTESGVTQNSIRANLLPLANKYRCGTIQVKPVDLAFFDGENCMSILTQPEGIVTGTAVKMFTVAGPVIVFGTAASVVYGLVLYLLG